MKSYIFRVELEQDDDGRWSAVVPTLPGCAAWGYTAEEALDAIQDATEAYVEVLLEDGREIPTDSSTTVVEGPAIAVTAVTASS